MRRPPEFRTPPGDPLADKVGALALQVVIASAVSVAVLAGIYLLI